MIEALWLNPVISQRAGHRGFLAVSPPSVALRIGVTAATEHAAKRLYFEAVHRWLLVLERAPKHVAGAREGRKE